MSDAAQTHPGRYLEDPATLGNALLMGNVGVWRWHVDTDRLDWSTNLEAVHGLQPGSFDGTLDSFRKDIHSSDVDAVWEAINESLESGSPYRVVYRTNTPPGRDPIWVEASGGVVTEPDGTRHLTGICMDVTARRAAERELERRLAQQKSIEQFGTFAFGQSDLQKVLNEAVNVAAKTLGVPLTKILMFAGTADHLRLVAGVGWKPGAVGTVEVGIERESQAGYTLVSSEAVVVRDLLTETRFSGPKLLHDYGVRSGLSVVIAGSSSRPFGVFGIHDTRPRTFTQGDVEFLLSLANIVANAARSCEHAEHRQLLIREMAHRAGNMLQLVSTLANQTFSSEVDLDTARKSLNQRLAALARANYLVAHGGWTSTRINRLFAETLEPFGDRIALVGRDVLLPPELSFDLALVVHELATNSSKYGSLGRDHEKVELSWEIEWKSDEQADFRFVWYDGINAYSEAASRSSGFGSRLLSALIEKKWGGSIDLDMNAGYRFSATIAFSPQ